MIWILLLILALVVLASYVAYRLGLTLQRQRDADAMDEALQRAWLAAEQAKGFGANAEAAMTLARLAVAEAKAWENDSARWEAMAMMNVQGRRIEQECNRG